MVDILIEHPASHPYVVMAVHIADGISEEVTRIRLVNICHRHRVAVNRLSYSHVIPVAPATGPCEWCTEEGRPDVVPLSNEDHKEET